MTDLFLPPPKSEAAPQPCRDCQTWERNPLHGCFNSICDDCKARDIAQGPNASRRTQAITQTEITSASAISAQRVRSEL